MLENGRDSTMGQIGLGHFRRTQSQSICHGACDL